MYWFLYDNGLRHERAKLKIYNFFKIIIEENLNQKFRLKKYKARNYLLEEIKQK